MLKEDAPRPTIPLRSVVVPLRQDAVYFSGRAIVVAWLPDRRVVAALRAMCDALQLDRSSQVRRIREDEALAAQLVPVRIETPGGAQVVEMLAVDAIPAWLAGIQVERLSPDKRPMIAVFAREAASTLTAQFATRNSTPDSQAGGLSTANANTLATPSPQIPIQAPVARVEVPASHRSWRAATSAWASLRAQLPRSVSPAGSRWRARNGILRLPRRRWLVGSVAALLLATIMMSQLNGAFGAWLADVMRATLGPQATAQIETWFLDAQDAIHQAEYHLTGQPAAPWSAGGPSSSARSGQMPLNPIAPLITPALPGEGVWTTAGLPPPVAGQPALAAKAFLRPDPSRPYAVVTLLQFDLRFLSLHLVAGKTEPGGPLGHDGPGVIPVADQQGSTLFAAFNGGFKYADGHYGLMTHGTIYVPPQPNVATIAVTTKGQVLLDAWDREPQLSNSSRTLVAYRQNAALLIDHGQLNPLTSDGAAWGGVWLNKAATWRSGLGLTDHGTLIYAAGDSLTAASLGTALQAAGATMAMQTDINPRWVRAFLYERTASGTLQITKLHPGMQGTGYEYLQGTERDFFYLTRNAATPETLPIYGRPPTPTPPTARSR